MRAALLFISLLALAACQAPQAGLTEKPEAQASATQAGVDSVAYKAHGVSEAIAGFESVCLVRGLSVTKAVNIAKSKGLGLSAPTRARVSGDPRIEISARIAGDGVEDPDASFDEYRCTTSMRGPWADQVAPTLEASLRQRGFQFVSAFKRTASDAGARGVQVVYSAIVRRDGRTFDLTVGHGTGGRATVGNTRNIYVSGTQIILNGLNR